MICPILCPSNRGNLKLVSKSTKGVKGNISTCSVLLPCEGTSADYYAHSLAKLTLWVSRPDVDGFGHGEMGYVKHRENGSTIAQFHRYVEVVVFTWDNAYGAPYRKYFDAPNAGSHTYQADLSPDSEWTFYYDDVLLDSYMNSYFVGCEGVQILGGGEIAHLKSQMVGTPGEHCQYRNIQVLRDESWHDAAISADDMFSDNIEEWNYEWLSSSGFDVWDEIPTPE